MTIWNRPRNWTSTTVTVLVHSWVRHWSLDQKVSWQYHPQNFWSFAIWHSCEDIPQKKTFNFCWYALKQGPLVSLPAFQPDTIKFCSMHILNLGIALWSAGSTLRVLLNRYKTVFTSGTNSTAADLNDNDLLALGYEKFRSWARASKIQKLGVAILKLFLVFPTKT